MDSERERKMLRDAVNRRTENVYPTSYADVKEGLIEKYGQSGWIGAMAQAITGSEKRSGKEYLAARRSIERYETGEFKTLKKLGGKIPDVGKQLPPIGKRVKGGSLTLTVKGRQASYSPRNKAGKRTKSTRERSFTATFTGTDAQSFADDPTYRAFFHQLDGDYPDDVIDLFEDGDYELDIYAVA